MRYPLRAAALAAVLGLAALSVGQAHAATPRERALARQVATLKKENAKLKRQLKITRAQLTTCQRGVSQAVSTMTPEQLNRDVMPIATARFDAFPGSHALGWTAWTLHSHTLSEGYYEQWSWTFNYTKEQ